MVRGIHAQSFARMRKENRNGKPVSVAAVVHISAGGLALILFWIPAIARKGSRHTSAPDGSMSRACPVVVTALVMSGLAFTIPLPFGGSLDRFRRQNFRTFCEGNASRQPFWPTGWPHPGGGLAGYLGG